MGGVMRILIPFLSAYLYWLGGQKNKWYRWGMGLPIGVLGCVINHSFIPLLCIFTYWLATSAFPYGSKSWLNFLPQNWKHCVCGVAFGLASAPILLLWSIPLAIISGGAFYCIERFKINNPWAELLRGGIGTCLL